MALGLDVGYRRNVESLTRRAIEWANADPEPAMKATLLEWVRQGNQAALQAAFEPVLEFGTAGIRGLVGPGPARMNCATVRRVTCAVAEMLLDQGSDFGGRPVVVGFDARRDSEILARETVAVFAGAGLEVAVFPEPTPTPLIAFAANELSAPVAVAITASHNPAEYNGYKLYGSTAIQIVPPVDREVALRISRRAISSPMPWDRVAHRFDGPRVQRLGESMRRRYEESALAARLRGAQGCPLRIAYSPLHGVGGHTMESLLSAAGYPKLIREPLQWEPDGSFPTIAFPNPEEPLAMVRPLALAQAERADLLLVNDPDADRLCVALPDEAGTWRVLSGNQLGVLLADAILSHRGPSKDQALVLSTIVSTPMTRALVEKYGGRCETTLTGFKWLWTAALRLLAEGPYEFCLAFEEAIGYSTHAKVRDKDGIAAALLFTDWVAACHHQGDLPWHRLMSLFEEHGAWGSAGHSVMYRPGMETQRMRQRLAELRELPFKEMLGHRLVGVQDFERGVDKRPPWLGEAELLILELEGAGQILLRPSGTEPKLKTYAHLRHVGDEKLGIAGRVALATQQAEELLAGIEAWLLG